MYLLDTDICSYILRERPLALLERFRNADAAAIGVSVITEAELHYGVAKSKAKKMNHDVVQNFLSRLIVHPWDSKAAAAYGFLRATLELKGTPIGNMDMMIAAHALVLHATVVTNNERHFRMVPDLKVENWAA